MKYIEPNITFSSSIVWEKKIPKKFRNLIDPLCQEVPGSQLYFHITPTGTTTILRYKIIKDFIITRLVRFYPKFKNIERNDEPWMYDSISGKQTINHVLFINSGKPFPVYEVTDNINIYDSNILVCHKEAFPIVIRAFINNIGSIDDLLLTVPFSVGGKNNFCQDLYGIKGSSNSHNDISYYMENDKLKWLLSRTNSWLIQMKRKGLKSINKEIIIPV